MTVARELNMLATSSSMLRRALVTGVVVDEQAIQDSAEDLYVPVLEEDWVLIARYIEIHARNGILDTCCQGVSPSCYRAVVFGGQQLGDHTSICRRVERSHEAVLNSGPTPSLVNAIQRQKVTKSR